jgi:thiosulfate/3-mercaptopyruvate sulfurtransferase
MRLYLTASAVLADKLSGLTRSFANPSARAIETCMARRLPQGVSPDLDSLFKARSGERVMSDVLISASDLEQFAKSNPVVLIDTRNPDAYAAGHIPGAVNLHDIFTYLATTTPDGMKELKSKFAEEFGKAGLSGAETAVVYEQSMDSGFGQSCRGYFLLSSLGYTKIKVLHGGFSAWSAAGLPVSTTAEAPVAKAFPVDPAADAIMLDAKEMLAALEKPSIAIVDVRDVDEWIGESSSPYGKDFCPRKGRIPGARWLEWYRMMKPTADGARFKSKEEILAECATIGVFPETPVYLYCFKGARASNTYVALKNAGIKDVRMYFGSWNEWSRDPSLPIESGLPFAKAA